MDYAVEEGKTKGGHIFYPTHPKAGADGWAFFGKRKITLHVSLSV